MTKIEILLRALIWQILSSSMKISELNSITDIEELPGNMIKVTYEDTTQQVISLLVTDTEEDQYQIH